MLLLGFPDPDFGVDFSPRRPVAGKLALARPLAAAGDAGSVAKLPAGLGEVP